MRAVRSLLVVAFLGVPADAAHGQGDALRAGVQARVVISAPDHGISGLLSDRSVIVGTVRGVHSDTLTLELPRSRGQLVVPLSAVARLDTAWSRRTWYTSAGSGLVRGALFGLLIAPIAGLAAEYAVRGANGTTAVHAALFTIGLSTAGGAVSGIVARSELWSRVKLASGGK
jgi:hypothetical protein